MTETTQAVKLSPPAAARLLRAKGSKTTAATVRQWITRGLHGRRLPAERIGTRFLIDPQDVLTFAHRVYA